jgi:hypothetical protein
MSPDQINTLIPAFSGFHQDFDLDDVSEREVLTMHARGLDVGQRARLYDALVALLAESTTEQQFREACWNAGAHTAPTREELESFVTWARTPGGAAVIAGPGPISMNAVVRAKIGPN